MEEEPLVASQRVRTGAIATTINPWAVRTVPYAGSASGTQPVEAARNFSHLSEVMEKTSGFSR